MLLYCRLYALVCVCMHVESNRSYRRRLGKMLHTANSLLLLLHRILDSYVSFSVEIDYLLADTVAAATALEIPFLSDSHSTSRTTTVFSSTHTRTYHRFRFNVCVFV